MGFQCIILQFYLCCYSMRYFNCGLIRNLLAKLFDKFKHDNKRRRRRRRKTLFSWLHWSIPGLPVFYKQKKIARQLQNRNANNISFVRKNLVVWFRPPRKTIVRPQAKQIFYIRPCKRNALTVANSSINGKVGIRNIKRMHYVTLKLCEICNNKTMLKERLRIWC